MHTYYLGRAQVDAYLKDFARRLLQLDEQGQFPGLWCPVGPSGKFLARRALKVTPELVDRVSLIPSQYDRVTGDVEFEGSAAELADSVVLVIDSSVHSGQTMLRVVRAVEKEKPKAVGSYSLVIKRGTVFVPNFFGVVMGDHDRAFFMLESCPNNRIAPFGCLRMLQQEDVRREDKVVCGVHDLDKFDWGDFFYDLTVDPLRRTYVYEKGGRILGYASFRREEGKGLLIDTLAVDKDSHGQQIGSSLMRWVENCGRCADCTRIRVWAREAVRGFYERFGYKSAGRILDLGDEKYHLMGKEILYNLWAAGVED